MQKSREAIDDFMAAIQSKFFGRYSPLEIGSWKDKLGRFDCQVIVAGLRRLLEDADKLPNLKLAYAYCSDAAAKARSEKTAKQRQADYERDKKTRAEDVAKTYDTIHKTGIMKAVVALWEKYSSKKFTVSLPEGIADKLAGDYATAMREIHIEHGLTRQFNYTEHKEQRRKMLMGIGIPITLPAPRRMSDQEIDRRETNMASRKNKKR